METLGIIGFIFGLGAIGMVYQLKKICGNLKKRC